MKQTTKLGIAIIALSTIGALAAYAATPQENDALITRHAAIPLSQAIQSAEQHAHGRAVRAELEHGKHGWVYDVEVVANGSTYDVAVDAAKGIVLVSVPDKTDHDNIQDKED